MLRFHSKRFALSVPFPDGRGWRIDDHTGAELVATHPRTSSKLVVSVVRDPELMNQRSCEERARGRGLIPSRPMRTIEEATVPVPAMFDTRVWVAIEPGKPLVGHVFAFGAFLRKCLVFHYSSEVATIDDELALSTRLALARTRIFGGVAVDAFDEPVREGH